MDYKTRDFSIYLDYFKGREEYIACQGDGYYYPIKQTLDNNIITKHIDGISTFGVYLLTRKSNCNFICIDIDIPKDKLKDVDFKETKIKFDYLNSSLITIVR